MWNWLVAVVVCPESKKLAADGFEAFFLASFMGHPLTPEALFEAEALEGSLVAEDSEGLLAVDVKAGLMLWDEDSIPKLKAHWPAQVGLFSLQTFGFEGPSQKERRRTVTGMLCLRDFCIPQVRPN